MFNHLVQFYNIVNKEAEIEEDYKAHWLILAMKYLNNYLLYQIKYVLF